MSLIFSSQISKSKNCQFSPQTLPDDFPNTQSNWHCHLYGMSQCQRYVLIPVITRNFFTSWCRSDQHRPCWQAPAPWGHQGLSTAQHISSCKVGCCNQRCWNFRGYSKQVSLSPMLLKSCVNCSFIPQVFLFWDQLRNSLSPFSWPRIRTQSRAPTRLSML